MRGALQLLRTTYSYLQLLTATIATRIERVGKVRQGKARQVRQV